jgi:hypothetical protein
MKAINNSEITIEELPPMTVGCYRAISATPEHDCSQYMQEWLERNPIQASSLRRFGFDVEVLPAESSLGKRGYETWLEIPTGVQPANGLTIRSFTGGLYAVMTLFKPFDKPFERIPNGWKFLHEWVLMSEAYQGGNHQWLEELLAHEDGDDLKLYHPVTARRLPG